MSEKLTPLPASVVALRFLVCLAIWMIMTGGGLANLLPGIAAAGLATWCSVALRPARPVATRIRPLLVPGMLLRFFWGSVLAGFDVAWRAFSPAMPLDPGFLVYPVRLPRGMPRNLFMSITSLMPGTLYAGTDESGRLIFHCLDMKQPLAVQLAGEEARLAAVLGIEHAGASPPDPEPAAPGRAA
jgi:multicomponent Na+:H+ antiporter subunit E